MNGFRKWSIYTKIIIAFLLAIIPLYALIMFVNERSMDALKKEIVDSMSSRVHFYKESLELVLDNLYSLQNNLASDRNFIATTASLAAMCPILNGSSSLWTFSGSSCCSKLTINM